MVVFLYKKKIHFFVIGQIKFLEFIVFTYLDLKLMLHNSSYIYPVVFTYKTCQNIFLFSSETDILCSSIFWEMHVLQFHRYQGIVILLK